MGNSIAHKISVRNEQHYNEQEKLVDDVKYIDGVKCVKSDIKRTDKFNEYYYYCKCIKCQKIIPIAESV